MHSSAARGQRTQTYRYGPALWPRAGGTIFAVMEKISGPFGPYFIAAYTVESEGVHWAYAKICLDEPRDVWFAEALDKVAAGPHNDAQAALAAVERVARRAIDLRRLRWPIEWTSDWQ